MKKFLFFSLFIFFSLAAKADYCSIKAQKVAAYDDPELRNRIGYVFDGSRYKCMEITNRWVKLYASNDSTEMVFYVANIEGELRFYKEGEGFLYKLSQTKFFGKGFKYVSIYFIIGLCLLGWLTFMNRDKGGLYALIIMLFVIATFTLYALMVRKGYINNWLFDFYLDIDMKFSVLIKHLAFQTWNLIILAFMVVSVVFVGSSALKYLSDSVNADITMYPYLTRIVMLAIILFILNWLPFRGKELHFESFSQLWDYFKQAILFKQGFFNFLFALGILLLNLLQVWATWVVLFNMPTNRPIKLAIYLLLYHSISIMLFLSIYMSLLNITNYVNIILGGALFLLMIAKGTQNSQAWRQGLRKSHDIYDRHGNKVAEGYTHKNNKSNTPDEIRQF